MKTNALLFSIFCLLAFNINAQIIRYVKPIATGDESGSSWSNASANLQQMINASSPNDEVWTTKDSFKPIEDPFGNMNPTDPRDKVFYLKDNVKLYGGFEGYENSVQQRASNHYTTLSGDIGIIDNKSDNCYHVLLSVNDHTTTLIDGFSIVLGNADGANYIEVEGWQIFRYYGGGTLITNSSPSITNTIYTDNSSSEGGGGIFNSHFSAPIISNVNFISNSTQNAGGGICNVASWPTVMNCNFISNSANGVGGGIENFNNGGLASPIIKNCLFDNNSALGGGGIYNDQSSPNISNTTFINNIADYAGGIYNDWSSPIIINTVFTKNVANVEGGGILNDGQQSKPLITNCTFTNNLAVNGGGIYNHISSSVIKNSIIWNNTGGSIFNNYSSDTVTYSDIQGDILYPGIGNVNINPLFVNYSSPNGADNLPRTIDDGITLQENSPVIDIGNNTNIPIGTNTDIIGSERIYNNVVDMGAYEYIPYGTSLNFDGFDDIVNCGNANSLNINIGTWEAWVKTSSLDTTQQIIVKQLDGSSNISQYESYYSAITHKFIGSISVGTSIYSVSSTTSPIVNKWYNIAISYDGYNLRIYINGVLENTNSTAIGNISVGTGLLTIGRLGYSINHAWKGNIDELRIWGRSLSQCEIQDNMNNEINFHDSSLIINYHFNQGIAKNPNPIDTILFDASGNNLNGILLNFSLTGLTSNWDTPGALNPSITNTENSIWLGISDQWDSAFNWSKGFVPSICTKVEIKSGVPFMPIITTPGSTCYKISLMPNTLLTIKPGVSLIITGNY